MHKLGKRARNRSLAIRAAYARVRVAEFGQAAPSGIGKRSAPDDGGTATGAVSNRAKQPEAGLQDSLNASGNAVVANE